MKHIKIQTERFYLKELTVANVSEEYLGWIKDSKKEGFILYDQYDRNSLEMYVHELQKDRNVLFLGIYLNSNNKHIGNIKYSPIDTENQYAIMGVLIGDKQWRGKGVFSEVVRETGIFLKKELGIKYIYLGVRLNNIGALKAYKKAGFVEKKVEQIPVVKQGAITMVLEL